MTPRPWSRSDDERMEICADEGLSARQAAIQLERTLLSVKARASRIRISFHGRRKAPKSPDDRLRERWLQILPRLKAALVADIQNNI